MKISVRFLLPIFVLIMVMFSQLSYALQYDEHLLQFDQSTNASVLTLDLNDDPDGLVPLILSQQCSYVFVRPISPDLQHLTIRPVTCPDARGPPRV